MRMKLVIGIAASLLVSTAMAADRSVVAFQSKLVMPDPALAAFVGALRAALKPDTALDYAGIDAMFAARVSTFQRGEDPLKPWKKAAEIKSDYLAAAARLMVVPGAGPKDDTPPDLRPEAARKILAVLSVGTFSRVSQVPFAVCSPASFKVNAAVAGKFAREHSADAASLRFFARDIELKALPTPVAKTAGKVPTGTLLAPLRDATLSDDWSKLFASNGVEGYWHRADQPALSLSQSHICFGKFRDGYKITALFADGH